MKRILFIVLDVLLLVIICLFMFKGVQIGRFRVLSFPGIAKSNEELTQKIVTANEENEKYNVQLEKIKGDISNLTKAKKEYLDLMTVSTDSEIQAALQTKTYTIEYLWSQVGNHATKEGVVTKMELSNSSMGDNEYRNLNFTITGNYLAITNFISDLENDSNLEFTIDSFDMKGSENSQEICTFVVRDVKIKKEETTATPNVNTKNKNQDNNSENNSNGNNSQQQNNNNNNNNDNNSNNNQQQNDNNNNNDSQQGNNQQQNNVQGNTNNESNSTVNP